MPLVRLSAACAPMSEMVNPASAAASPNGSLWLLVSHGLLCCYGLASFINTYAPLAPVRDPQTVGTKITTAIGISP